jgi:DNA-binding NtrC family response regulator
MAPTSTTRPSPRTDANPTWGRPTHLRWVFPAARVMPFARTTLVVGREEGCDLTLEGSEISRRHAEFRVDGPLVAVRDLDSRNGVFVNGARRADAPLVRGDLVRCGEWIGVAVTESAESPGFGEITPGWFGGATLRTAIESAVGLASDLPTVVQGETGTGKEGLAQALHRWSGRGGPFVAVNCAALPSELAEAELFGYRKGAFTGAQAASPGLFRAAQGGTLFLDEVLELPLALQPKLLRALEERRVRALGETQDVAVDVRIVAATQEPLATAVAERRFRADLQARLDGMTIVLPPLRDRREDIAPLFLELLRQSAGQAVAPESIEPKLVEALCLHDWPLNVRELSLLARRLIAVHGREPLKKAMLPERMLRRAPPSAAPSGPATALDGAPPSSEGPAGGRRSPDAAARTRRRTSDETEFDKLIAALRSHDGSVARAAEAVGIGRARAYRLLSAHPDFSVEDLRPKP